MQHKGDSDLWHHTYSVSIILKPSRQVKYSHELAWSMPAHKGWIPENSDSSLEMVTDFAESSD